MPPEDKQDEQKTERFNMFMSPSEMDAIDEWAWKNRIRSKSEAVRRLVQMGMQADESLSQIRDQSEGTYEFIAGRLEQTFKDIRAAKTGPDAWRAILDTVLTTCVDTMQMVGNLSSTARQAADRSDVMKGEADVPELISRSKEVEREYEITKKRISEIVKRTKDE